MAQLLLISSGTIIIHQTKMQLLSAKQSHRHSYNQTKSSHGPVVGLSGHSIIFIRVGIIRDRSKNRIFAISLEYCSHKHPTIRKGKRRQEKLGGGV